MIVLSLFFSLLTKLILPDDAELMPETHAVKLGIWNWIAQKTIVMRLFMIKSWCLWLKNS